MPPWKAALILSAAFALCALLVFGLLWPVPFSFAAEKDAGGSEADVYKRQGYEFVTNGDTETIVHGYEAWGTDVFEKLRGMFAIAIWDAPKKRLVCARDLFGICLLYTSRCV